MNVERLDPPAELPCSLTDLAEHLRLDGADAAELAEAARLARAAALEIEDLASIAALAQPIRVTLPAWPIDGLELALPIGPVLDGATATVTIDGAPFTDQELNPGLRPTLRITAEAITDAQASGRWVISYTAGFGADAASLPEDLQAAIRDQAAALFDQRGGFIDKRRSDALSPHAARVIGRYRGVRV